MGVYRDADPTYRLAALDEDFILGDSMRGARFMMEYAKAEEHLREHKIRSTAARATRKRLV